MYQARNLPATGDVSERLSAIGITSEPVDVASGRTLSYACVTLTPLPILYTRLGDVLGSPQLREGIGKNCRCSVPESSDYPDWLNFDIAGDEEKCQVPLV